MINQTTMANVHQFDSVMDFSNGVNVALEESCILVDLDRTVFVCMHKFLDSKLIHVVQL